MASLFVSPFDKRAYDAFTLSNGIDVLLCNDPTAKLGAAVMGVTIGACADGDIPGTAHLLEHMLFVQSKKYTERQAYQDFVGKNSGTTNAYTANERTVYYFEIPDASFEKALDMFAQFFVGPLFDRAAVDREINAVNSEHSKNLHRDTWRMQQLNR
jgi:insulysin